MKIRLIAPGKIKEKWLTEGIEEYRKRLSRYSALEIIEVADSPDSIPVDKALAKEGESDFVKGGSVINIAIGGSNGLSPELVKRADRRICLGKVTYTHQMTRLILLEQIYRGFKIASGEKYHK